MEAVRFVEPKIIERVDVPAPESPGPGSAMVRTHRVGVCGTDISGYLGRHPFFTYPRIPGHELGVEVLDIGADVEAIQPGDRCAVEPYLNDPESFASRRGIGNCCQDLEVLGVHVDGGLCERFTIRANKLHPSRILSYDQLALVETLAIGCHACNRADPSSEDHVLVIGVGPIGCAVIQFLKLRSCQISVMDLNQNRLNRVRQLYDIENVIEKSEGHDEFDALLDITGGELFSYVFDVTGSAKSMGTAPQYVRHGGTLVFVGNTTQEICFNPTSIQKPEITIMTSRNALPGDFQSIIESIERGEINTDPWITHRTTMARMPDVFESYTCQEAQVLKAMISV